MLNAVVFLQCLTICQHTIHEAALYEYGGEPFLWQINPNLVRYAILSSSLVSQEVQISDEESCFVFEELHYAGTLLTAIVCTV